MTYDKKRNPQNLSAGPARAFLSDKELRWLQISAGIAGFIGITALVALLAQGAHAADAPRGATPPPAGGRTFTNPFANPPGGAKNNFFDDDEEEDAGDFGTADNPFSGMPSSASPPAAGGPAARAVPPAGGGSGSNYGGSGSTYSGGAGGSGVSLGGTPPGGVVARGAPVKPAHVDVETGEGSKEIVTDFNFPDADIMDIAKTLGKLTGKNFILDKDVKGRVTIISNSAITVADAWKAFLTALDINGFALIPSGKYIRIARQRDARDKQLRTYTGDFSPDTDALITRVFPLKYINAEEVARTFRSFMPANSRIIPYDQTNTVIVTDTGANISKLNKMLEILDVEGYDAGIEVIPVKFASAAELSKLIDTLIPGTGGAHSGPPGAPRFGGGPAGSRFSARRTKEGGIINTIIADERTNTLIVHANTRGADQVRELVAKLDQKQPTVTGGGKVHVVYLQFADAEQISTTLNNLSSQVGGGFKAAAPGAPTGGTGTNPVTASLFEGSIKVAPDKNTNSLVITASPGDFVTVQRVINRLDIPRDEVYVEVVVMEVAVNRGSSYSANVIAPTSLLGSTPNGDLFDFLQNPLSQKGAVLGFVGGGQREITIGSTKVTVSSVQGLIKAIQTHSRSNILATPQIIALDNSEATFESAEKIPIPVQNTVQGVGVQTSIQKESVALSIKIKPQINKLSNFVKLETEVKLGDISNRAVPQQVQGLAFATLDRTAKTTVVVGDADTIVIGGLIRDKISESVNKIPILGDIPVLGWLFKSRDSSVEKTNLLVFLTPHIVRQYEKVREILDKKLKERDDFIEKSAGGEDPLRDKRDEIIRGLPDLKELQTRNPETSVTIDEEKPAAVQVAPGSPFTGGTGREGRQAPAAPQPQAPAAEGAGNAAPIVPGGGASSSGSEAPLTAPPLPSPPGHATEPPPPPAPGGSG